MGKALTSPVKLDPPGHDGICRQLPYLAQTRSEPRHLDFLAGRRQDTGWHWADCSSMARERAKLLLPDESVASLGPFLSRPCPTRRTDMGVPELWTNATSGHLACFVGCRRIYSPGSQIARSLSPSSTPTFSPPPRHGCRPLVGSLCRHCRVICGRNWPHDAGIPGWNVCLLLPRVLYGHNTNSH